MSFDQDRLEDRLDASALSERLDERVDVAAVRERLDDGLDSGTVREGLDDLCVRYFMPPSVTGDTIAAEGGMRTEAGADDVEVFDFGAWLQEDRETGPTAPPSDPRVVTGAAEAAGRAPSNFRYFDFTGWLSEGETYGPVAVLEPEPDAASGSATEPAPKTSRPLLPRPSLHPVKAGTFALFLAVVALVGLTIVGDLQAVAPAAGIAP